MPSPVPPLPESLAGQRLLQAIFETTTVAIFVKDREGRYALVNRHAAGLWRAEERDILGKTDFDLFPEEVAATLRENDLRVLRDGETVETEETVVLQGRERTYFSSKVPLRDESGQPFGVCGISFDISHLHEAEQALRESEARFRTMADSAPVLIWMSGADKGGVFFNETWLSFRGKTLEEELGGGWIEAIHPDDRPALETCEEAFRERRRFRTQFRMRRHDGEYRWMLDTGVPRYEPDGTFGGFIGSCVDVTDRIRLEETLRSQAEALAQTDRRKDEFLAMLGHELRNPMAPLRNAIALFRSRADGLDDELRRSIGIAERQLEQIRRIVDDLLDVARVTRGQVRIARERMPLRRALETALETVDPYLAERESRLEVVLPPPDLEVDGDAARLAQVFSNLLHNAAKYSPRGGRITVVAEADERWATVEVRDSGIGMDPTVLAQAFDLFFQRECTLERSEGGLGLGLTLARSVIELHGGEVTAESAGEGAGSVFRVRLPRLPALRPGLAQPTPRPATPPPIAAPAEAAGGCRVLIVDDNRDSADSLGTLLELGGHHVEIAYDGESGLEAADRFAPDVVLLDIGLPRLDGYEVARRLRQTNREDLMIIAVTGYGQESARAQAAEAGFDHHLLKPVDLGVLRELIGEAASRRSPGVT